MSQVISITERVKHFAFAPLAGLDEREEVLANTHVFKGDGTSYLKVPGLKRLDAVRLDSQVIPMEIVQEYPTDHTLRRLETVSMPTFVLGYTQDGTAVLRRNICSNDSIFQKDRDFYISGEWDENAVLSYAPDAGIERLEAVSPKKGK